MTGSKSDVLVCWKCGAPIIDVPMPLGRTAVCTTCDADLHVCKLCGFYDTGISNHCREPIAEPVKEKERANFCDYFKPRVNAYMARDQSVTANARAQLENLFGNPSEISADSDQSRSPEDIARAQLEDLFKK